MRIWKPSTTGVFIVKSFCATFEESFHDKVPCALAWAGCGGFLLGSDSRKGVYCRFLKKKRIVSSRHLRRMRHVWSGGGVY